MYWYWQHNLFLKVNEMPSAEMRVNFYAQIRKKKQSQLIVRRCESGDVTFMQYTVMCMELRLCLVSDETIIAVFLHIHASCRFCFNCLSLTPRQINKSSFGLARAVDPCFKRQILCLMYRGVLREFVRVELKDKVGKGLVYSDRLKYQKSHMWIILGQASLLAKKVTWTFLSFKDEGGSGMDLRKPKWS